MDKLKDILKEVTSLFNIYLTILLVAVALLLSPSTDYNEAIAELKRLKNIEPNQYKDHVSWLAAHDSRFCPPGFITYPGDTMTLKKIIEKYFSKFGYKKNDLNITKNNQTNIPNWKIYPVIADYRTIPIDSSLLTWEKWFYSTQEVTCYVPDWDSGIIYRTPPAFKGLNLFIRGFNIAQSPAGTTGDFLFRVYFDTIPNGVKPNTYFENGIPRSNHCCEQYDSIELRYESFIDEHPVIQMYILKKGTIKIPNSGVYQWIHNSNLRDSLIVQTKSGERFLPALHDIWSEINSKTVYEALNYLETRPRESRKLTLVGIDFSFSFVTVIIPIALFLINVFIFLHLKYLTVQMKLEQENLIYPWIGLYKMGFARLFELLIFVIAPTTICLLLIRNFGNLTHVEFSVLFTSYLFIGLILLTGIFILIQNKRIRQNN